MAGAIYELVNDFLECAICSEACKSPKLLPCFHTFCLKCIEKVASRTRSKQKVPCPLCRREFCVPPAGIAQLPGNFFAQRLLDIAKVSDRVTEGVRCDICADEDQKLYAAAAWRCLQCGENLCNDCLKIHRKAKATRSHTCLELASEPTDRMPRVSFCSKHANRAYELYCGDCSSILCVVCLDEHTGHRCSNLNTISDRFRDELKLDVILLSGQIFKFRVEYERWNGEVVYIEERFKEIELHRQTVERSSRSDGSSRQDEMLRRRQELLSTKSSIFDELQRRRESIAEQTAALKSLLNDVRRLVGQRSQLEVCRLYDDLHSKTSELLATAEPVTVSQSNIDAKLPQKKKTNIKSYCFSGERA